MRFLAFSSPAGKRSNTDMEIQTIRAMLIGGAVLLAIYAQLIPRVARFAGRTHANSRSFYLSMVLVLSVLIIFASALVALFMHSLNGAIGLLLLYIVVSGLEFSQRPWPVSRWEIASFVVLVAFTASVIGSISSRITWEAFPLA